MNAYIESKRPGVTHYVKDLSQAAAWYRDMLGLEIGPHDYGSFVEMHLQGQYMFHLSPASNQMVPHSEPVFGFSSSDIEQSYSFMKSSGVEVGPMHWYPDYSSFTFQDLDGNAVAVTQNFEMRIRELEALQLVGIRVVCADEAGYIDAIPQASYQLRHRLDEISGVIDPHLMVGVYKPGDTVAEEDGYWVCTRVDRFEAVPEGMMAVSVPAQRYAVKWHYGPRSKVGETYRKLHKLMDDAGLLRNSQAWHIEMQRNWGVPEETDIEMDLYDTIE
jgi:predicted transcriptional regulator YdeE